MPVPDEADTPRGAYHTLAEKVDFLFRTVLRDVTDKEHARDVAAAGGDDTIERRQRLWTQAEVGAEVGHTPEYIGWIRNGTRNNPNLELIRGLARLFGVPVSYLAEEGDSGLVGRTPRYQAMFQQFYEGDSLDEGDSDTSLADRLNTLFDTVRPDGGDEEYTDDAVATVVRCTPEEIRCLRQGTVADVGITLLRSLARFFGVPVAYLVGGTDETITRVDQQLAKLRELRTNGLLAIAMRASHLGTHSRDALARMVETFIHLEKAGQPGDPPPDDELERRSP